MTEYKPEPTGQNAAMVHRLTFQPMGISCQVLPGTTIMEAAQQQDIPLRSECGGQGTCAQCQVDVSPLAHCSEITDRERTALTTAQIERGRRFACQTQIIGPLSVSVSDAVLDHSEAIGKTIAGRIDDEVKQRRERAGPKGLAPLGISLDIGTTTLACYLCDLDSGEVLNSRSEANPQRRYGEDVVSRIAYANEHESGLEELQQVVRAAVNSLIVSCLDSAKTVPQAVREVTVVGNTTMQHLFVGKHPRRLGSAPYLPESCEAGNYRAADLGLGLDAACPVYVFPVISGFVGGDTVGVMLSEKPYQRDDISLIIDIGTNGELILGSKKGLWVTSCATGPALEGAHIECGMRAVSGAIQSVSIDPATLQATCRLIQNNSVNQPRGLCGSGIIDTVAEMLKTGLLLPSGRLREGVPGIVEDERGIGRKYVIIPASRVSKQREIALTLSDIRQVQLAKAALSTGIKLLLRRSGIERFDRLILTGAFGAKFNWKNAVVIGMLPEVAFQSSVLTVENAAGRGALMALLKPDARTEIQAVARRVKVLELAEDTDFITEFSIATRFPEQKNSS